MRAGFFSSIAPESIFAHQSNFQNPYNFNISFIRLVKFFHDKTSAVEGVYIRWRYAVAGKDKNSCLVKEVNELKTFDQDEYEKQIIKS